MAKNIQSLQLLRNTSELYATREAALAVLTGTIPAGTQDGTPVLARYKGTDDKIYTLVGYYAAASGITGGTVTGASNMTVFDFEGSAADVEELRNMIGTGVTTANTVTKQLQDLSGTTDDTSATTSVAGAKKYADEKIAQAVDALDYTDTAVAGQYVSQVSESNGVISVTRAELPTVAAISEAGKPITAVSESLGAVSATAGTINAEYVNVTGSVFSSTTVQGALEEIETEYKAADVALKAEILGGASESADTLGELEALINELSADAKEYSIKQITTGLSTNVKEAWGLFDADNNQSGATINIYKDSAYKEIYLGTSADTINTTTGEITKQEGDKQSLNYAYMKADGTYDLVKVDVSAFLSENEFASGVTATDHIVHGVVDSTSEKDGQATPVDFLTVGENGFKVSGIKDEIDRKINALDATVTGGTTAGTATNDHIQVVIAEADGKLTGVTVTETNIADADDLATLSGKTVTEVASSNNSITAALSAATDGTKHLDIITDASKIQMSGFTSTDVLSGITQSSSITEAFLEVDKVITENEETVSAALNDLEETKVENIVVNGVTGTFNNKVASVTIDGGDVVLGADYAKPATGTPITTADTVDQALGKLEAKVDAATSGGITGATVNNAPLAITSNVLKQTVVGKQSEAIAETNEAIVVETDANGNLTLGLANLDAGTY